MKKPEKQENKTQGDLLRELYAWSGKKTQEEFAKAFKKSRHWYLNAIKEERIPLDDKYDICRAYNIPLEYFERKYTLPMSGQHSNIASEPGAEYNAYSELQKKYNKQTEELLNAYRENRNLREEITELLKEKTELLKEKKTVSKN